MITMRSNLVSRAVAIAIVVASGCVEPYDPPTQKDNIDFLVIDGYLNASNGSAVVSIMHSVPLNSDAEPKPEDNAEVVIVDDQNNEIALTGTGNGIYSLTGATFDLQRKYHVTIRTSDSNNYFSDPFPLRKSPPIDSVNWFVENDFLNIRVYTHDPTGASKYYKWDFVETYQYTSPNNSNFLLEPGGVYRSRRADQGIYVCYKSQGSTIINIESSNRLTEDIISGKVIRSIPGGDILISKTYSILVQQQTLTEESYNYWLNVKKTTEALGGLFDPLPAEVIGNVHSSNINETVIGYISGGEVAEKRIFIEEQEHSKLLKQYRHPLTCDGDTVLLEDLRMLSYKDGLINAVYSTGGFPVLIGFTYNAVASCNDCRIFGGGSVEKPIFWNK